MKVEVKYLPETGGDIWQEVASVEMILFRAVPNMVDTASRTPGRWWFSFPFGIDNRDAAPIQRSITLMAEKVAVSFKEVPFDGLRARNSVLELTVPSISFCFPIASK